MHHRNTRNPWKGSKKSTADCCCDSLISVTSRKRSWHSRAPVTLTRGDTLQTMTSFLELVDNLQLKWRLVGFPCVRTLAQSACELKPYMFASSSNRHTWNISNSTFFLPGFVASLSNVLVNERDPLKHLAQWPKPSNAKCSRSLYLRISLLTPDWGKRFKSHVDTFWLCQQCSWTRV